MDREVLASWLALEVWVKGYVKPTSHQSTSSAHMKCWLPWSDRSLRLEIFRRVPNGMKVVWRNVMNRFMALAICLATATDPRTTGDVNQAQFGWNRLWIGLTTLYLAMCRVVFPQKLLCKRCLHCSNMRRRTIFEFVQSVSAMCWPLCSVSLRCHALTQKLQDMSVFLKRPFGTESMFVFIYLYGIATCIYEVYIHAHTDSAHSEVYLRQGGTSTF